MANELVSAELVNDVDIKDLILRTDNELNLTTLGSMEFAVIGQEEMAEISEFISETHAKMLNNFSKSQSNFMDTMLVFNASTDIRNLRQISAEIEKKKMALVETQFKLRKKEIELKQKMQELENTEDPLEREMIGIEIEEMVHGRNQSRSYIEAALKTILCMKQQYEQILESKGIEEVTEKVFEDEEKEYHIKKACHQAFEDIVASGRVSVGNNKYLLQLGIMPNVVHNYWIKFLNTPQSQEKELFMEALDYLYNTVKPNVEKELERRGMKELFYDNSVLQIERK